MRTGNEKQIWSIAQKKYHQNQEISPKSGNQSPEIKNLESKISKLDQTAPFVIRHETFTSGNENWQNTVRKLSERVNRQEKKFKEYI